MAKMVLLAIVLFGACDPIGPFQVPAVDDAGVSADAECQQWGVDGTGNRFCVSTAPDPCAGPWGCAGK